MKNKRTIKILLLLALGLSCAAFASQRELDETMTDRKRTTDEELERNVKRKIELTDQLVTHIKELLEGNKFKEYFELIDSLDPEVQKAAYELEFIGEGYDRKAMHWAAFHDNVEAIKELRRRDISVNTTNKHKATALWTAVGLNKREAAKCLIALGYDVTADGLELLCLAAENGNTEIIEMLVKAGIPVNAYTDFYTALHVAAKNNQCEAIRCLVRLGAHVDALSNDEMAGTPLYAAAAYNKAAALKVLKELGANPNTRTKKNGTTPLHIAAWNGYIEILRVLKELGADLEIRDDNGNTPLHTAVGYSQIEAVKVLKELGCDIHATYGKNSWTALHLAAPKGLTEIIKCLVEFGADLKTRTRLGFTPLHMASAYGMTETIRALKELGADLEAPADDHMTSLHVAANRGQVESIKVLKALGANIAAVTKKHGLTPLHLAAGNGDIEAIKVLKELGANLEAVAGPPTHIRPLHLAIESEKIGALRILKEFGANLEAKRNYKEITAAGPATHELTGLYFAVCKNLYEAIDCLRELGADLYAQHSGNRTPASICQYIPRMLRYEDMQGPNSKREKNCTLLMDAARLGFTFIVRKLLEEKRLEVNCVNHDGDTALHLAAREGHAPIVYLLLQDSRVKRNVQNSRGNTAFHLAIENLKSQVATVFLLHNVDCDYHPNRDGKTVRQLTQRFPEMKALFENITPEELARVRNEILAAIKVTALPYPRYQYARDHYLEYLSALRRLEDMKGPNGRRENGETLLIKAARLGLTPLVRKLLQDTRLVINSTNEQGETALHKAAWEGHATIVEMLLKDPRIDRYYQNFKGETAFHYAVAAGKAQVVAVFLRFNTDCELPTNHAQKTVLDLAENLNKDGGNEQNEQRAAILCEFENMAKIRIAIATWKSRQSTDCINPLPEDLCERFTGFAQDALRRAHNSPH